MQENKSGDWSGIIFMDEWTFYFKPSGGSNKLKKMRTTLKIQSVISKN